MEKVSVKCEGCFGMGTYVDLEDVDKPEEEVELKTCSYCNGTGRKQVYRSDEQV